MSTIAGSDGKTSSTEMHVADSTSGWLAPPDGTATWTCFIWTAAAAGTCCIWTAAETGGAQLYGFGLAAVTVSGFGLLISYGAGAGVTSYGFGLMSYHWMVLVFLPLLPLVSTIFVWCHITSPRSRKRGLHRR